MALSASFERATKAMFKSKLVEASDNIRAKLSVERDAHAALRARLPAVALAAEMGEPGSTDSLEAIKGEIRRSEENISTLNLALVEAEAREQARLSEAERAADRTRVRALAQHLARLRTAAAEYESATRKQKLAWENMLDSVRRARPLLEAPKDPGSVQSINPSRLANLCVTETQRIAFDRHPSSVKWPMPGVKKPLIWTPAEAETLISRVSSRVDRILEAEGGEAEPTEDAA
jgi:hypothetical protein